MTSLTIDSNFGAEVATSSLSGFFLLACTAFHINGYPLSTEAQTALFTSTLMVLMVDSSGITALGDTSQLTNLSSLSLNALPNLWYIPTFSSSINLSLCYLSNLPAVQGFQEPWLAPGVVLKYLEVDTLPLLGALPVFNAAQMLITNCKSLTTIPAPSALCALNLMWLNRLPSLYTFGDHSSCPLTTLHIDGCPHLLTSSLQNTINGALLTDIQLNYYTNVELPNFVCAPLGRFSLTMTYTRLATLPACLCSANLVHLELAFLGIGESYLPQCIFSKTSLEFLHVAWASPLVANASLSSLIWNLPNLKTLCVPSDYLVNGIPAQGSVLGNASAFDLAYFLGIRVSGAIPDNYFTVFANVSSIFAPGLNISGTIPSSIVSLVNAKAIALYDNVFSGTIP